jgi:hypothetical protein
MRCTFRFQPDLYLFLGTIVFLGLARTASASGGNCVNWEFIAQDSVGQGVGVAGSKLNFNRNSLFLPANGSTDIYLDNGPYGITRPDAVNGPGDIQIPNPFPDDTGTPAYTVNAVDLSPTGASIAVQLCATDPGGNTLCKPSSLDDFFNLVVLRADGTVAHEFPLFQLPLSLWRLHLDVTGYAQVQLQFCQ